MNNKKPYKIGDAVVLHIVPDFDWNKSICGQVLMTEEQKEIFEKYHTAGINPVFSPAWQDGKLIGFGLIPAERAAPPKSNRVSIPEEVDLLVAKELREYNELRHRVGETDKDYLDGVYRIYDILREAGAKL